MTDILQLPENAVDADVRYMLVFIAKPRITLLPLS